MHRLAATFLCLSFLVQRACGAEWREVESILPRALETGETVLVEVQLGTLPRGLEIEITTASGRELGVISPHGIRTGNEAGTYTLPIPPDVFSKGRAIIRLSINEPNHTRRAPNEDEVKSVRLKIAGGT
ncbi:MAG: hypothetical protein WAO00_14935 [Chthoniobacterales bacterium]